MGCPGFAVSLPSGVAFGAVLTLALPSFAGAFDGDVLGEGVDAAAVAFSGVGDSETLVCGVDSVGDGVGLSCGRSDTSGTLSLGAAMVNDGAEGAIAGVRAAVGVTGTGASWASSCGRGVGASTCCAVRGRLGTTSGVAEDCRFTVGATCAGIGIGCMGVDGGAAGVGAGSTAATLGNATGASEGFSTAICGGVMVGADCTGLLGSASDGSGGMG